MRIVNTREYNTGPDDLAAIRTMAGNDKLAESEVFIFPPFLICHSGANKNHTDITAAAQKAAVNDWLGKAILLKDHQQKTENQIGRIYKAWIEERDGVTYTYGKAYGVRTDDLADVFKRIENRVHQEMSCAYEPSESHCSLCSGPLASPEYCKCAKGHTVGQGGCIALDTVIAPDHVSFVASPAVDGAGLVSAAAERMLREYGVDGLDTVRQLQRDAADGQLVREWATAEFGKWYRLNNRTAKPEEVKALTEKLSAREMISLAKLQQSEFSHLVPDMSQQTRAAKPADVKESPAVEWRDDSDVIKSSKQTRVF